MPIKVAVYNIKGEKVGDINLSEAIFGLPANNALLHQVYVSQAANKRIVIAHTKDRGERAGSGKKPLEAERNRKRESGFGAYSGLAQGRSGFRSKEGKKFQKEN